MACSKCNKKSADTRVDKSKFNDPKLYFKSKFSRIVVFIIIFIFSPIIGLFMNYFVYKAFFGNDNSKENTNSIENKTSNEESSSEDTNITQRG